MSAHLFQNIIYSQRLIVNLDGTLYDTYGRITRAAAKALGELGVKVTAEEIYPVAKRSLFVVCAKWAEPMGFSYDQFLDIYHRFSEQEGAESIRPFPGALETLKEVAVYIGMKATDVDALMNIEPIKARDEWMWMKQK